MAILVGASSVNAQRQPVIASCYGRGVWNEKNPGMQPRT